MNLQKEVMGLFAGGAGACPLPLPPLQPLQSVACGVLCPYSLAADSFNVLPGQACAQIITFDRFVRFGRARRVSPTRVFFCMGPARDGEPWLGDNFWIKTSVAGIATHS